MSNKQCAELRIQNDRIGVELLALQAEIAVLSGSLQDRRANIVTLFKRALDLQVQLKEIRRRLTVLMRA